jgi:hypothetical protein
MKLASASLDQFKRGRNNRLTSIVSIPFFLSKELENELQEINGVSL